MKYPKRSQYKYKKSQYRIRNWPEYEAGLKRRGDLTLPLRQVEGFLCGLTEKGLAEIAPGGRRGHW